MAVETTNAYKRLEHIVIKKLVREICSLMSHPGIAVCGRRGSRQTDQQEAGFI